MKICCIYCIRNIVNNKIYIGSTENFKKRKKDHLHLLRKGNHHSRFLQRSFTKHGENNFEFSILEECNASNILPREQHYIDTLNPRYNICRIAGSSQGVKRTEEQKRNISEAHKGQIPWNLGIPQSEEQKLQHSKRMKGTTYAKGKKWSEESKKKLSESQKGKLAKNRMTVEQYDLEGNFIQEFPSQTEARIKTGALGISQCLKGKYKSSGGYIWKEKVK